MSQFQPQLIHESLLEALHDAVRAIGGTKKVGALLWPAKTIDEAKQRLNDCLNPHRAEKLSPEEVLYLLRTAREVGYHGAMDFIAAECGYTRPEPVAPSDELAQLQREFIATVKTQQALVARIERITQPVGPRAVAA
jgi:hypothetical protein